MPSVSRKQQKFFQVVRAIQKGTFKGNPSKSASKAARSTSVKATREFAGSVDKGFFGDLRKEAQIAKRRVKVIGS